MAPERTTDPEQTLGSTKSVSELTKEYLDDTYSYDALTNPRLDRVRAARAEHPNEPFFAWAILNELHWYASTRRNATDAETSATRLKELEVAIADAFSLLDKLPASGAERLALHRLAHLMAGLCLVRETPSAEALAGATRHAQTYEKTRDQDLTPYEEALQPGCLWRMLKARTQAWRVALKPKRTPADFVFAIEAATDLGDVVKEALDPLVGLSDYQTWAFAELAERKLTKLANDEDQFSETSFVSGQFQFESPPPMLRCPRWSTAGC